MYTFAFVIIAVATAFYHYGQMIVELLQVGSGFTATTVCFGHFVSQRRVSTVISNELNGLSSYITTFIIDEKAQSVTAYPHVLMSLQIAKAFQLDATSHYLGPDLGCRLSTDPVNEIEEVRRIMSHELIADTPLPARNDGRIQALLAYEVSAAALIANQTRAMIVLHHGEIVGEAYQSHIGISKDTKLLGWSMTKSVQAMLVGVAIQKGLFNLSTPSKFIQPISHRCGKSSPITIGDLLTMSDILPFEENYGIHAVVPKMLFAAHDTALFALSTGTSREVVHKAKELYQCSSQEDFDGDVHDWYYSSGLTNLLAREVRSYFATDEDYWNFPRLQLFEPLGISAFALGTDPGGTFVASSFSYGTARSWAKLGQLMLQRGRWGDKQLIPKDFVAWVQAPHPFSGGHYGGSFWLNPSRVDVKTYNYLPHDHPAKQNHYWMTRTLPSDAFFMSGFDGQYTIIIPSLDAVIVRLGFTSEQKNANWDKSGLFGGIIKIISAEKNNTT